MKSPLRYKLQLKLECNLASGLRKLESLCLGYNKYILYDKWQKSQNRIVLKALIRLP